MNDDKIRALTDKYLAGKTSLSEEQILREYFNENSVPENLRMFADIFDTTQSIAEATSSDKLSESSIDKAIDQYEHLAAFNSKIEMELEPLSERNAGRYWLITAAAGVAAILLIIVAVQTGYIRIGEPDMPDNIIFADTFNDPEAAKEAAENALSEISETLNSSMEGLANLSVIDKSAAKLNKLSILDEIIKTNLNVDISNDKNQNILNTNKEN